MASVTASASTGGFALNAFSVTDASNFASSDTLVIPEQLLGRPAMISGTLGSGAIANLTITAPGIHGGTHADYIVDPTGPTNNTLLYATTNAATSGANTTFLLQLTSCPPELIFKAKKVNTNTTLTITGTILGGNQPRS